ncbi:MAG TPA: outer membrane beta-barrel protein [Xanthobacteraceae bacterium]|nr:outer membrane beta-barrel protein [Xanthobacteraceae bacterium]
MANPFATTQPPANRLILAARIVTITVALACGATAAVAADMSVKAAAAPSYQWSGCYVGLNLGGGASTTNFGSTVDPGTYLKTSDPATVGGSGSGGANADGVLAGGQAGCNFQSGTLVYGLEGDLDYFRSRPRFDNNTNTLADGNTFAISQLLTTNHLATMRPRIGIAADRNLAYITGGAAFTNVNYTENYVDANVPPGAGAASASRSLLGWTAGAGWEYALADHWTVRAEYLFASFPTTSATGLIDGPGGTNALHGSADLVVQIIRAGVNFKF